MPLVRIDVVEGRTEEQLRDLADAVHDAVLEHFAAPSGDRYQIISEHPPGHMLIEDTGLGIPRTDRVVVLQITQQGRTAAQKRALYAGLAAALQQRVGLDPADLVVSVVDNTPADWSFGYGRAQFLEGDLP
jgi:phenylpyruvate tautomerase PptA (4-oxalocrotonate tautomerase family)